MERLLNLFRVLLNLPFYCPCLSTSRPLVPLDFSIAVSPLEPSAAIWASEDIATVMAARPCSKACRIACFTAMYSHPTTSPQSTTNQFTQTLGFARIMVQLTLWPPVGAH